METIVNREPSWKSVQYAALSELHKIRNCNFSKKWANQMKGNKHKIVLIYTAGALQDGKVEYMLLSMRMKMVTDSMESTESWTFK